MAKKSKKYAEALSKIDRTRLYDATEALSLVADIIFIFNKDTSKFNSFFKNSVKSNWIL